MAHKYKPKTVTGVILLPDLSLLRNGGSGGPEFTAIKHNKDFRRFMLRGLDKVEVEVGLLAIAHNLAKMTS